jgi:hypothetical protein
MHEGTYEDGRRAFCWSCRVEHFTLEAVAPKDRHWLDLCEFCMADYFEGRERGAQEVLEGSSDFERRSMTSVMSLGYMAGRFLQACKGRDQRKTTSTEYLLRP